MKTRIIALLLLIASFGIGYFVYSSEVKTDSKFPFKLGLDLDGGSHLTYKADVAGVAPGDINSSMEALRDTIERRVNLFGVSEPLVQIEGGGVLAGESAEHKLIVELPGVTDVTQAIEMIGKTPHLEFKLLKNSDLETVANQENTTDLEKNAQIDALFQTTGLTGRLLERANLEFDPTSNMPVVSLLFTEEGKDLFAKITKENIGNILAIFLDNQPLSLPVIQQEIRDGRAQISGNFTADEARKLVRELNYGALPVPIELLSTQTIGASLGQDALHGGVRAGIWSFIVISIFLVIWYRLPGLLAVIALAVYTAIMLALFKLVGVTLTAAGIAAFILSIGMAVDANILIFERMKEEFARGKTIDEATHEGFSRAWLSIRDSNFSSIITGVILYYFGSTSVIKGFALVFILGVLVSMFTAITMSRTLLFAVIPRQGGRVSKFLFNNGFHFKRS